MNGNQYRAVVTVTDVGAASSITYTTHAATLTVAAIVIHITTQPADATVTVGAISGSLTVAASVTPSGTPAYQWYSNTSPSATGGTLMTGATSATFTIPTILPVGTVYYYCVVTATGATDAISNVAKVTVTAPVITITSQPAGSTTVTAGAITGSLSVAATVSPSGTPTYQWYSNTSASTVGGALMTGATSASLTIPALLTAGEVYYYCVVSFPYATSVTSSVAKVTVEQAVITITSQPAGSTTVTEGSITGSLTVAATVSNGATPTYQWYRNTSPSSAGGTAVATGASYAIPTGLTAGTYYYYCVATSPGATAAPSSVATVTVEAAATAPVIAVPLSGSLPGGTVGVGYSATLTASGTTPITWSVSSGLLPDGLTLDGTTGVISGTPTTATPAGALPTFSITATNAAGSDTATFSIQILPPAPPSQQSAPVPALGELALAALALLLAGVTALGMRRGR
jgi:hypothetical protein